MPVLWVVCIICKNMEDGRSDVVLELFRLLLVSVLVSWR